MEDTKGIYGITFNEIEVSPAIGYMSFEKWKKDPHKYDYEKEKQNLIRELNTPPLEFLDIETPRGKNIGKNFINKFGSYVECIEYVNCDEVYFDIITELNNGDVVNYITKSHSTNMGMKGPFDKGVYNTGYMGPGEIRPQDNKLFYDYYHDMMKRVKSPRFHEKQPAYKGLSVDPRWYNYQTFYKWCLENHYKVPGQKMQLDKDILFKGNKIYGPDTCVFVPVHINNLFTKTNKLRGDLPIGVTCYRTDKYGVMMSVKNSRDKKKELKHFGFYPTPIEAFDKYKEAKEKEIKRVADLYREWIPERLYIAMYNYQVEITD